MEIKIRYTFKRKSDGHIWQEIVPIECLEGKGDKPFILSDYEKLWELIARELWTGLIDKNKDEIYEGDLLRTAPKEDWDKTNYATYEVFFHDGDANMDYNIGFSMCRTKYYGSLCGGYIPSFKPKTVSKMEITGNIHYQ